MTKISNDKVIDLLYISNTLISKIHFFKPYKNLILKVAVIGLISSTIFYFLDNSKTAKVEYIIYPSKSIFSDKSYDLAMQNLVTNIIKLGKLESYRNSDGKIYKFIVKGYGKDNEDALRQAINKMIELNDNANYIAIIELVKTFIREESNSFDLKKSEEYLADINLIELEKKLNILTIVRNKIISEDLDWRNSEQFSSKESSEYLPSLKDRLRPINDEIMNIRVDINKIKLHINKLNEAHINQEHLNQLRLLISNITNENPKNSRILIENIRLLINSMEITFINNSYTRDRLISFKLDLNKYSILLNQFENSKEIIEFEKKYNLMFCILMGFVISLLVGCIIIIYKWSKRKLLA